VTSSEVGRGAKLTLIATWRGTLSLPSLPIRRHRVGGNLVVQTPFTGAETRAELFAAQEGGYEVIKTSLQQPFHELALRRKGARRTGIRLPVVTCDQTPGDGLPDHLAVRWDTPHGLDDYADTPEKVLSEWTHKFEFRTEDPSRGLRGLRPPQTGALHAIAAHFAVGSEFEPATIVLPTGTGKTETMLAAQIYRGLPRTLVLVPSDALRDQIAGKFETLGVLPLVGVIPNEIARPRVVALKSGMHSVHEAEEILKQANVVVALPNTLEASHAEARQRLLEGCTDLMVDEAHHVGAATWAKSREPFLKKRIVQFTATPFRRDDKRIDGKIIFNFKLGDAQEAGYYQPINLVAVEEYGDQASRDRAVAGEAIKALRRDREELGLDHLLMARTGKKDRAEELLVLYQELAADMRPVVVYSGAGRATANREALDRLHDRGPNGARIVICVDMLGEGYDLPNLKIAALHDTHKSLAVTLQFIGRFTRSGPAATIGEATVVTNIADPEAERKLADLYAEGADWDRIIQRLSEERIEEELRLQDVVEKLKGSGDLHARLSLWNLRPVLSTQIFRTKCNDWNPVNYRSVLPAGCETWHALDAENNVLVAVVQRSAEVKWGNYQDVVNVIYDLLILRWDRAAGALFVHATDYSGLRSERLAQEVTDEHTELLTGARVFQILNNVKLPLVKSLGSSRIGAISFTSYFGPNVTEGLASIEKAEAALNNIACVGYENGDRVLWGGTQKRGKVWQQKSGTIAQWIDWTTATWAKVSSEAEDERNITRDFLRPEKMDKPLDVEPIAVQWGEQAQMALSDQWVCFGETEVPLFAVDLDAAGREEDGSILIRIVSDLDSATYRLRIDAGLPGGYRNEHVKGATVKLRRGKTEAIVLEEYLQRDPFIVRYADGTYSYNCYRIAFPLNAGAFDRNRIEEWDWTGVPLNKESIGKGGDKRTIQYRTFERLRDDFDLIFNDDGCGEAADLVCFKDVDDTEIRLTFVHCKGAHGGVVSQDIRNFYVVCGQAQKSVAAKHLGIPRLYVDLKRRADTWAKEGHSRFLKGDLKLLTYFKEKSRRATVEFEMILVQPGASVKTVTDDSLRLLATTELYLTKTTEAKFRVATSA
jgi:superfamily II DNA or RNA helicase